MSKSSRSKFTPVKTAKRRSNSSAKWLLRQLNDPYVKLAHENGYRSRAAFKIIEIDQKFKIFKKNKIVLDLGAAPGGWSQIAAQKVGYGNVLAIDLLDMPKIEGVEFIKQDFLADNAHNIIIEHLNKLRNNTNHCDIILTDMAENTCGDPKTDHLRIVALLEEVLFFADKILSKNGSFIGKIFQGGASSDLLKEFNKRFKSVKHFKPNSSRKESAENYLVATGFIGSDTNIAN